MSKAYLIAGIIYFLLFLIIKSSITEKYELTATIWSTAVFVVIFIIVCRVLSPKQVK